MCFKHLEFGKTLLLCWTFCKWRTLFYLRKWVRKEIRGLVISCLLLPWLSFLLQYDSISKSVIYDCPGECSPEKDCDDIDRRFDNPSGSHHQSQVNCESLVDVISLWLLSWLLDDLAMLLVICQLSRDVIGCNMWLAVKRDWCVSISVFS